jgi:CspA family cold shock protein
MGEQALQAIEGAEGLVKWFDPRKGFGFIVGPEGQDIFTHYTVIQGDGFRVLKDGASVQYDAVRTEKGWKATRVVRVEAVEVPAKRGYTRSPRQRSGDTPPL